MKHIRDLINILPLPVLVVNYGKPSSVIFNDAYVKFRKNSRVANSVIGKTIYPVTAGEVSECKSMVLKDLTVKKQNDTYTRVKAYGIPVMDKPGKLLGVIELLLEENMGESQETEDNTSKFFENILENIDEGIIYYDRDFNIKWMNSSAKDLLDFWSKKSITNDIDTKTKTGIFKNITDTLRKHALREDEITFGKENHKLLKSKPITDKKGNIMGVMQTIQDISELEKVKKEKAVLKNQFIHAQKMESLGRLASGISHDYRNIITAIIGLSDLLIMDEKLDERSRKAYVMEIRKAAVKAKDITDQLLVFSRKHAGNVEQVNLNDLIVKNKKIIQNLIGEDIILETRLGSDIYDVNMNGTELIQILMNLAVNSRDAMPKGGRLLIETKNTRIEKNNTNHNTDIIPGDYVLLTFSDNGNGMDSEIQKDIFKPFFTTKVEGKGTGLGLSTVFDIVDNSGGFIDVHSEPQVGTTFRIYFPGVLNNNPEKNVTADVDKKWRSGSETILLVEDDNDLKRMMQTMLKGIGYSVVSADSSREALEIIESDKLKDIDLILTDVIMPEINGNDLVKKAIRQKPQIKFLFISGYTENIFDRYFSNSDGELPFISKPFTTSALAGKLREILDDKR